MARVGGFSVNLDPFGSGRGGLGRYNITGETISSLAETEAYAVAVAWANGQASDEEYLASLRNLLSLATPGSRDAVTAQNKLDDATYTIGRNVIVRDVNNADSMAERTNALRRLGTYDAARLAAMSPDNQAYREQQDRVAGSRVDVRQAQYSELVDKVNLGKATTEQLRQMAVRFAAEADNDPDADDWTSTVASLNDRILDEQMSDYFQDYQHNRMSGASLLAKMDARLAGLEPGSPAYRQLKNQREDLAESVKNEAKQKAESDIQGRRSAGKVSDKEFLGYLQKQYADSLPGSNEQIQAGNRLREYTFSLAEDKLRFDVSKGTRPVSALIAFYKSYRATMNPGSERYRTLTSAIDSLTRSGGSSGGGGGGGRSGGGGGSSSGSGIVLGPKLIGDAATSGAIQDLMGGKGKKPPPDFNKLFSLDITNSTSAKWFDNNLRSMVDAFQDGDTTWTYYDQRGNGYSLAFVPSMMQQMDSMNLLYAQDGLRRADTAKEAQRWVGKAITAGKAFENRGGQFTMDVYTKMFGQLEAAKERALGGGRFAEYAQLAMEQRELMRQVLGLAPGAPLDVYAGANSMLTGDQKGRIAADLAKISPRVIGGSNPEADNPGGDPVLAMMDPLDGGIQVEVDADGRPTAATLDPRRGWITQGPDGRIKMVVVNQDDPWILNPQTGEEEPAYISQTAPVVIRQGGQDMVVRQPLVSEDGTSLPVYMSVTATGGGGAGQRGQALAGSSGRVVSYDPYVVNGALATIGVKSIQAVENGKQVTWVSLDGKTWVRYVKGQGQSPRIVIDSAMKWDGKAWTVGGQPADPATVASHTKWWGQDPTGPALGAAWGRGAPGAVYVFRTMGSDGSIDMRSVAAVDSSVSAEGRRREADVTARRVRTSKPKDTTLSAFEAEREWESREDRDAGIEEQRTIQRAKGAAGWAGPGLEAWKRSEFANDGDITPKPLRPGNIAGRMSSLKPIDPVVRELGVKPVPKPVFRPAPTPSMADPYEVNRGSVSRLKPVTKKPLVIKAQPKAKPKPKATTQTAAGKAKDDLVLAKPKTVASGTGVAGVKLGR